MTDLKEEVVTFWTHSGKIKKRWIILGAGILLGAILFTFFSCN